MEKSSRPLMYVDGRKRCPKCRQYKPPEEFHRNKRLSDGLASYCKQCKNEDERRIRNKRTNKERAQFNKRSRDFHRKRRVLAIETLGGKCVHCEFSDIRALQIDHIHGDGATERKKMSSYQLWQFIINHPEEAQKYYQCLCANCNVIKAVENNENTGKPPRIW